MKHASGTAIAAIRRVISDTLQTSESAGIARCAPAARSTPAFAGACPDPVPFALITWVELAFAHAIAQHVGSHRELSF